VSVYSHVPHVKTGDNIRFPARLKPFKNFNNPGRYDYEAAMKLKDLTCAASVSDGRYIVPMGKGRLPFHRELMEKIQRPVREFFINNLEPEDNALFRAMNLGERQGINNELREPFNRTGLGHVLAVSGLHIGLVAWIAFAIFKWCLSRPYSLPLRIVIIKPTALLTCLPVLCYIFIAGFQVSSQRAMIMIMVFLFSLILGREKEIWSTLALAGLLILAVDPHSLFSMSFQLSFSALIGILWLTPALLDKIPAPDETRGKTIFTRLYTYFTGLAAVCIAATLFLLPIILVFFHRISLVTIPANLMVVPILGLWVIPLGLLSTVALPLSTFAAEILLQMSAWGMSIMMGIIRFWADIPWCSIWTITPSLFEMILFYALIFFIYFFRNRPWAKIGALVTTVFFLAVAGYWIHRVNFNKELRLSFLDVGQANAALVEFPGGGDRGSLIRMG
jgi:competence protein ComEC